MKVNKGVIGVIVLGAALVGCGSGGLPEADSVNCAGRGMEKALVEFKNNEPARQAFLDKCNEINQGK
ncbi:entry exclusion lipoprotein TrbK [Nitrosomonas sp.]|uniref:entry exclusion lipoprotein TrbK n=1 Tax=Nitrosomonas sp. TaxID=42353 RepID=UPI001E0FAA2A|nr:entry exclusion lipoprotein TrbK [Nitrosomonas sp.]MBX3617992.1 entry exclusion lipoprotein TrbK [Nitrosomonas sp.]